MSGKFKIILFSALGVMVAVILGSYFGLTYYYSHPQNYIDEQGQFHQVNKDDECYYYGVYINDIYATGKTAGYINDELAGKIEDDSFTINVDGQKYSFKLDDISFKYDYLSQLEQIAKQQNPFRWYETFLGKEKRYTVVPAGVFDDEAFEKTFSKLNFNDFESKNQYTYIELTEDEGYKLINNKEKSLNVEEVKELVKNTLSNCEFEANVSEEFFTEYEYTKEEKELFELYEKIDDFQSRSISYKFGKETRNISKYELCELLNTGNPVKRINPGMKVDEQLSFDIDEKRVIEFIDFVLEPYNTYNNRHFITHSGAEVLVTKGNYGNKLDMKTEEKEFVDFFFSDRTRYTRTPKYLIEKAKYKELNDFGDTFIEISLDEQMMWFYVKGEVFIETPVTTGSRAAGGTAPRVVSVYNKIPGKWLNGPTWHVWVDFWVPIEGAIGIHDSSWRSVYGGTEYIYNGSHGCINTPRPEMEKLYNKVEIGTPVIVYSIEKNGIK